MKKAKGNLRKKFDANRAPIEFEKKAYFEVQNLLRCFFLIFL